MIRILLATTALSAAIATGAFAQDATAPVESNPVFSNDAKSAMNDGTGYFTATENQVLASALIGKTVYNGTGEEAESVGEINDVVIGPNGMAEAVVVGVGGFLGIGQKDVAVDFDKISWADRDGVRTFILEVAKADLEAAPQFDRVALEPAPAQDNMAATETTTPGDVAATDTTTPGDTAATDTVQNDTAANDMNSAADVDDVNRTGAVAPDASTDSALATDQREGWTVVDAGKLSAEKLVGTRVYGANDSDVGEIGDVIVTADGKFDAYIVDVGGFLGMGEKPVALDATKINVLTNADGELRIYTSFTEDQLKQQPNYDEAQFKADRNSVILN